jgi:hypothetical protein
MDEKLIIAQLIEQLRNNEITLADIPLGWKEKVEDELNRAT